MIELAAPATDGLGRGGLDGDVDTHFFERFGGAILLTLLNIGGAAISDSTDTSIVIVSTRAGVDAGSSSQSQGMNIGPDRYGAARLARPRVRKSGPRLLDGRTGQDRRAN